MRSACSQCVTAVPVVIRPAIAILLATFFGRWYWNRRVVRWAEEQGLTLLEFRGARSYEGPRASVRTESRFAFRVVVEDASRVARTGWLSVRRLFVDLANGQRGDSLGQLRQVPTRRVLGGD